MTAGTLAQSDLTRLREATSLLQMRRGREAVGPLRALLAKQPGFADAHRLLGLALREADDRGGAEASFREAFRLDPASGPNALSLSELLSALSRADEALAVIAPLAASPKADLHVLTRLGEALKALGRREEARVAYERAVAAQPASAVAEHNLAGVLGDMERFGESEAATRRAFAKGLDGPETWLVHARALLGQSRYVEAEHAYRQVIARRPGDVEAHGELAQLLWMCTGDARAAQSELIRASETLPQAQGLLLKRAELLEYAGDPAGAYRILAPVLARADAEPMMHVLAARLSCRLDPERAVFHARHGAESLRGDRVALSGLCEAYLAVGNLDAADLIATELHERAPLDQYSLGLLSVVWRLTGDARYQPLHDYDRLVRSWTIDTPEGWSDLNAYLVDLARSLSALHTLFTHPVGQSVRHGSQTSQSLTHSTDPAIQAFFHAVDGPIRRHIQALGEGADLVRSRRSGGYAFNGVWSVRLRPNGFHADHLHPLGWLSSACYIALPAAVDSGREGWLKFAQPGVRTTPALDPEYFVKPEPGMLVLFPSYMWHGTVPFSGEEPRLTIAFDVVPAAKPLEGHDGRFKFDSRS